MSETPEQPGTDVASDPFLSLKAGSTEIYLIRHADALPAAEEVSVGGYDAQALSELGRRQAQALAERLRRGPLAAVSASPIGRARETAGFIAEPQGLEVQVEPELREVDLGQIGPQAAETLTQEELAELLRARL